MENKIHWTEPRQENKSTWIVEKIDTTDKNKVVKKQEFKSKQDALTFLKTINVYINDKLAYSGI